MERLGLKVPASDLELLRKYGAWITLRTGKAVPLGPLLFEALKAFPRFREFLKESGDR